MRVIPRKIIPQTVTILNKLKRADSATDADVWYKTILHDCAWSVNSVSSQSGTATLLGATVQCQIPQRANGGYLPYNEWSKAGAQNGSWTVSLNDYIVLGEVTEDITPKTITQVMAKYEPNACKVRVFEDLTFDDGVVGQGFLEQYASIYYVEGA